MKLESKPHTSENCAPEKVNPQCTILAGSWNLGRFKEHNRLNQGADNTEISRT